MRRVVVLGKIKAQAVVSLLAVDFAFSRRIVELELLHGIAHGGNLLSK